MPPRRQEHADVPLCTESDTTTRDVRKVPPALRSRIMSGMRTIPIICYHNIGPTPAGSRFGLLYVNPEKFERQLWMMRSLGLRGVAVREGRRELAGNTKSNLVMLTFDDGYVDTVTVALPLLKKY